MKHPIQRRVIYLLFQGLRLIIQSVPLQAARAFGRGVGRLAYLFLGSQKTLILNHLESAFGPQLDAKQRRGVARRLFLNLGQNGMEWLQLPRWSVQQLQQRVHGEGIDNLRQALALGRGAIIVSGHFGNWELMPLYLRSLGFEGEILARPLRYPEYEAFLVNMRKRFGMNTLLRGSLREAAKLLKDKKIIGMLPDQDTDSLDGIFINFLGRPAYTPVGPAALSVLTGAPIVPVFNVREGSRFRLFVEQPILPPEGTDRLKAIEQLTQAWSDVLAAYITRYPDHWVWMHRRWKTQPKPDESSLASAQLPAPAKNAFSGLAVACCLMAVLALSGCGRKAEKSIAATEANAPTQAMSGFTLTGYKDDGSKNWTLDGLDANVSENIVTIQQPKAVGFDAERKAYLTASIAQVDQRTRHVRLENEVTIHTSDGLWFASDLLHWIPDKDEVATDHPVRIETDHMLLRGRGFTGYTQLKQAVIADDIEMVLNPTENELSVGEAQQVIITCDGPLSFDYAKGIATFENNVHIKDPNGDLYSDKLVAYLNGESHTIRYAEAFGRVRIHQNQNTALSEKAIYEPDKGKITLVGKPSLLVFPESTGGSKISLGGLSGNSKHRAIPLPHQPQMETKKPSGS